MTDQPQSAGRRPWPSMASEPWQPLPVPAIDACLMANSPTRGARRNHARIMLRWMPAIITG